MASTKITKHKSTIAPWECAHCGLIWYGITGGHKIIPDGLVLCVKCWNALDNYLYEHHQELYQKQEDEKSLVALLEHAREWISNKNNKPRPLVRRFNSSVPKWMRSAIDTGLVKTNGSETYVVYSEGQNAIKVEVLDR